MSVKRKALEGVENGATATKQLKPAKVKLEKRPAKYEVIDGNEPDEPNSKIKKPKKEKSKNLYQSDKKEKKCNTLGRETKTTELDGSQSAKDKENAKGEKPEKKKESTNKKKQDKKKLKSERQEKKKNDATVFDIGVQAKKVWNAVRGDDCPEKDRKKMLEELHALVKGNLIKIIQAHDTVRVVECLMAKGDESLRNAIYEELKGDLVSIAKSKYGVFFVQKLLQYGTQEQKEKVMKTFEGKIAELTRHKVANVVVQLAYNDVAKTPQQNRYLQEFFGPEYRLCKEENLKSAVDIVKKHPKKEGGIRRALAENCNILISKGCYNQSIVHSVLYNYMQLLNYIINNQQIPDGSNDQKETSTENKPENSLIDFSSKAKAARAELISQLRDVCVHILHSQDGARLSMNALWHGSAKDRKAIIKSFKTFVPKICGEEFGHMVLLAAFDCVDDTKLVSKAVINEIIGEGKEATSEKISEIFASEKAGRKVFLYLLTGRDTTFFPPDYLALLKEGDNNEHTKKEDTIRRTELLASAQDGIYKFLCENMSELLKADSKCAIFIKAALNCTLLSNEKLRPALERLADIASDKFEIGQENLVESAAGHQLLKKVISHDKVRNLEGNPTFSQMLLDQLKSKGTLEGYVKCNRGAFLLVNMMETDVPNLQSSVKEYLKVHGKNLKLQKTRGAEILRKKLN